jgi:hypothetical protein
MIHDSLKDRNTRMASKLGDGVICVQNGRQIPKDLRRRLCLEIHCA